MPAAFDSLVSTYDADFTASPIARHLRERVHARLDRLVAPGETALELGCGAQNLESEFALRGGRVDRVHERAEEGALGFQPLDHIQQMREGSREPVDPQVAGAARGGLMASRPSTGAAGSDSLRFSPKSATVRHRAGRTS